MGFVTPAQLIQNNIVAYAADTYPLMQVKHVGPQSTGTVQVVVASNKIVFKSGGSNDSTIQLGTSAAAGEIVYGTTANPTYQQMVDHLNKSPNWRASLRMALPAEVASASADPFLNDASARDAHVKGGVGLFHDTSQAFNSTTLFGMGVAVTMDDLEGNGDGSWLHYINQLLCAYTGSGAELLVVYAVNRSIRDSSGNFTVRTLFSRAGISGTALDTTGEFAGSGSITGYGETTRMGQPGEYLVARIEDTAALTSPSMTLASVRQQAGCNLAPAFSKSTM